MHYDYTDTQLPQPQLVYTLNAEEMQTRVDRARRELAGVSLMLEEHLLVVRAERALLLASGQAADSNANG